MTIRGVLYDDSQPLGSRLSDGVYPDLEAGLDISGGGGGNSVVTLGDKGDLGIRAVDKDNKVVFFPIDLVDDSPRGLVLGGIPADARVIVAGQELVKEGDVVKPVEADQAIIQKLLGEATTQ